MTPARHRPRPRESSDEAQARGPAAGLALAVLLVVAGVLLMYLSRETTFWFDEWDWIIERREASYDTYLSAHNEHLSLVPVAIYKLLFAVVGLDDYRPYRLAVTLAHLACVSLVFAYARARVSDAVALSAAVLLLFLGAGWNNILVPFQLAWLIAVGAGIGALLALDRNDRRGDGAAAGLLTVSLASSGVGLAIALGMAVDVLLRRRRIRDAWIVAVPVALYAAWWVAYYDEGQPIGRNLAYVPRFVATLAASAVGGLTGLGGPFSGGELDALPWGRPLAVAVLLLVGWRLAGRREVPWRAVSLLTILLGFWVLTGLGRALLATGQESRYIYVGAVFLVLLAVELSRGISLSTRGRLLLAGVVAAITIANVGLLGDAGAYLRAQAIVTKADLGALEIARPVVPSDHVASGIPGYPLLVSVVAARYYETTSELGTPAASPDELAALPEKARRVADAELIRAHGVGLRQSRIRSSAGPLPAVDAVVGGTVSVRGGCLRYSPAAVRPPGTIAALDVTLPSPGGLLFTTEGGSAGVSLRRFADNFADPVGTVPPSGSRVLRVAPDAASRPWRVRLTPAVGVTACGLAGRQGSANAGAQRGG